MATRWSGCAPTLARPNVCCVLYVRVCAENAGSGVDEEEEEVDVEGLAAQWLDTTVTAAANVYAKAIAQVPHISQQVGIWKALMIKMR